MSEDKLSSSKLEKLQKELLRQHDETLKELKIVEASLRMTSQAELSGNNSFDEEFADSGSATFERERDLSLFENLKDVLSRIDRALKKIETEKYGVCIRCGNNIPFERLQAIPYAELCIECKKKEESVR